MTKLSERESMTAQDVLDAGLNDLIRHTDRVMARHIEHQGKPVNGGEWFRFLHPGEPEESDAE